MRILSSTHLVNGDTTRERSGRHLPLRCHEATILHLVVRIVYSWRDDGSVSLADRRGNSGPAAEATAPSKWWNPTGKTEKAASRSGGGFVRLMIP